MASGWWGGGLVGGGWVVGWWVVGGWSAAKMAAAVVHGFGLKTQRPFLVGLSD